MKNKVRHVVILGLHRDDAYSDARSELIGQTGVLEIEKRFGHYLAGGFTPDRPISVFGEPDTRDKLIFFKVRVKNCPKEKWTMRGKIIDIHKRDAFYEDSDVLVGKTGEFDLVPTVRIEKEGYKPYHCVLDRPVEFDGEPCTHFIFYAVKVEPLPEEE